MLRGMLQELERFSRTTAKRSELTWRYGLNLVPTVSYKMAAAGATAEGARTLRDLNRNGVALTSVDGLMGRRSAELLYDAAASQRRATADTIAAARASLDDPSTEGQKAFVVPLLGQHPALEVNSPFAVFALHPAVLHIVNGYYGMHVRLKHYNIWQNLRTSRAATQSQLWHRDPEDRYILKVFVALEDVDQGCGPFTYAAGSHRKGHAQTTPEYTHKDGNTTRSTDAQMAAVVPPDQWVTCAGPKGTMIFADTQGFHRGGLARERDRVLFVAEYTSLGGGRGGLSTRR